MVTKPDTQAIPKGIQCYGSTGDTSISLKSLTQHILLTLKVGTNKESKSSLETHPCNSCGKLGHWAPTCTDKDKSPTKHNDKFKSNNNEKSWRISPSTKNESESKSMKGKELF